MIIAMPRGRIAARCGRGGTAEGGFAGLGEDGSLLLETGQGLMRVAAGEVLEPDAPGGAEAR